MSKIIVNNLSNLQNEITAVAAINSNDNILATAFDNTLSRNGTAPNQMLSNLDMNSYHILNLPEPSSDNDPIRKIDLTNVSQVTNVLHTASSTTNTIGTGAKTFTVPSSLGFFPGQYLLIQVSGDTTKYMLSRVTSYAGTSLVVNSLTTAGSGTFSNWVIDLSGPIGAPSTTYDTVTNAISATIDPTISFLSLVGYYTIGDGGSGKYQRVGVQPSDAGKFQSADGSWWHLISQDVAPEMFGCKGDGTTNDYANFQNCIDFLNVRNGGVINLTSAKNYRMVINGSTPEFGVVVKAGITINFNAATVSFECDGGVIGFRPLSHTSFIGPGNIFITASTSLDAAGSQSIFHSAIGIGPIAGAEGTVASPGVYQFVSNIIIDGLTISSVRTSQYGALIQGYGGESAITIRNNVFPDNANMTSAIGFDWLFVGAGGINSANIALSRINYDAGTTYSTHPHDILIENNTIGTFSYPYTADSGSIGVRISGCYNTTIRGNDIKSVTYVGIWSLGGDESFEFAPATERYQASRDIIIEDNTIRNVTTYYGILWDAYPDNVYRATVDPLDPSYPYSPIFVSDGYFNNSCIRRNTIISTAFAAGTSGILTQFTRGLNISENSIQGFGIGINIKNGSKFVVIENNDVSLCVNQGISVNDTTLIPEDCIVRRNRVYRNCISGSTFGNIYINLAKFTIVDGNIIGIGEDQSLYGLVVDVSATSTSVTNNDVYEVKNTGTAYKFLEVNGNTTIWVFRDNRYQGAYTYLSSPAILPVRRSYSTAAPGILITHCEGQRGVLTSDITPTWGTWGVGSTILNIDATLTGQVALTKCVTSGTPGTWKAMSTLP